MSIKLCYVVSFLVWGCSLSGRFDVNVVGLLGIETTAPLIGTTIIDALREHVKVNLIASRHIEGGVMQTQFIKDLPFSPASIGINSTDLAPISLLTDVIGYKNQKYYNNVPKTKIKLAYSMFEADRLPSLWIEALNGSFDAVIVPDEFLLDVYKNSGVTIPIFVIPLPIYIDDMLNMPLKTKANVPFIFGVSAGFDERKNHKLLLNAFAKVFSNSPHVKLKIHGSWGNYLPIENKINSLNLTNVEIITKKLSRKEYVDFIASLDCYIFLSAGEGYSITPRDALALGIPCILTDHTVHTKMCKLPSVLPVETPYLQKAYFKQMEEYCGNYQQPKADYVSYAMKTMYNRYSYFLSRTHDGREWVKQFTRKSLAMQFVTLIKPEEVVLGDTNSIKGKTLTTTSEKLYKKYQEVMRQN